MTMGFSSTVLETANRHAEEVFTQTKHQYLSSFPVQHQRSSSSHNDDGCLELVGELASIGWPVKQVNLKIWVERGIGEFIHPTDGTSELTYPSLVPSEVVAFHPPAQFTPFLSKTLYILRLYKLIDLPSAPQDDSENEDDSADEAESGAEEEADGSDEASDACSVDDSSDDSEDESAAESDSDPDKGKHNKKRRAKEELEGSSPPKRRKTAPSSPRPKRKKTKAAPASHSTRHHHQVPCPEIYTTLFGANNAACELQTRMMHETPLGNEWQANNAANLRRKMMALQGKEGKEGYWRSEFNVGLGINKFELVVEQVSVSGPRNV
ncbi:hypothetical protein BU23DRAFT_71558 [Bimuria novae-zelandiae CBS 107.79]|uniref:Uncharacterized protein n=1 Tax=Bimuria novae-zelandiae CBS 107.79 TaxID=1447943 RepID=A0A6A5UMM4_9PLEO|nr:hypothetical protein BU23DRAFT_71558 [Bimuria novae-zelandiae CBS 107.79]